MLLDRSVRFAQIGCFRFADFRLFIRSPLVSLDNVKEEARLILSYEVGFFIITFYSIARIAFLGLAPMD